MADQDNYSDIPQEVPLEDDYAPDPESVARGHKATLRNPNVSEKAKQHSRDVLKKEFGEPEEVENSNREQARKPDDQKDSGNVARGLKAAISNPGVSNEAKEGAQDRLNEGNF
ncbi:Conidiation-specific protein 6 [Cladobotryum mycophilum]|uniref:Conidiation-specific protein 6 n=1 Tax=Cladobotryum mycophilum TaxID=491253 RepID=A0ABR0SIA4_9HYPO